MEKPTLVLLDILFFGLHLILIGFNLTGWVWKKTLKLHLATILLTAGSWLVLGIWYGLGYCPLTDWHWQIKRKLGESDLPASFITYFTREVTGIEVSSDLIDWLTAIFFILAAFLSIYRNIRFRKSV
ncbi:MAG: DUF2784 domain-containing protein [Candidatus Cyclobacteriaceae bacterium M3_2C_046]